jgi:hypothetical protein
MRARRTITGMPAVCPVMRRRNRVNNKRVFTILSPAIIGPTINSASYGPDEEK